MSTSCLLVTPRGSMDTVADLATRLANLPRKGSKVDQYTIIAEIAHGGMAAVYAAKLRRMGGFDKIFAIKFMLPTLSHEVRFRQMFLEEARLAARFQHPNVVQVFDVGSYRDLPYMVMEFLRGQPLDAVLHQSMIEGFRIPRGFVYRVLAQAAKGLHAAHEARDHAGNRLGVVHRDVSPSNIHIGYDGQVKVVDFGIAAAEDRISATKSGEVKGKLLYMAPEQLSGSSPHRRMDIWALGVVAWELLTGRCVFEADRETEIMWNVMNLDVPSIGTVAPNVSRVVAQCVDACLSKDPSGRPETALEVADLFEQEAQPEGVWKESDIAAFLEAHFADARVGTEERLAGAIKDSHRPGPNDPTQISVVDRPKPSSSMEASPSTASVWAVLRPRRRRWAQVGIGVVAVATLAAVAGYGLSDSAAPEPVAAPASAGVLPDGEPTREDSATDQADPGEPTVEAHADQEHLGDDETEAETREADDGPTARRGRRTHPQKQERSAPERSHPSSRDIFRVNPYE